MDRRDLLKIGAVAALEGCAVPNISFRAVPPPPAWTAADVDEAIADLDATIGKMSAQKPDASMFVGARALDARRASEGHDLVVRTLSAMHVAATFRELPADVQARDDVMRLMWRSLPMIDSAMLDVRDHLANLGPSERRAIQDELRKDPAVAMNAIGKIDERASAAGVSFRRRMQLRALATHVTWRMTKQSVDTMLDETLERVHRVTERHARDEALRRRIADKIAEAELFDARDRPAHAVLDFSVDDEHRERNRERRHTSFVLLGVGGVLFGLGGVSALVGAVALSQPNADIGWAVPITIGAALGVAAIVTLIIGAVLLSTTDAPTD